MEDVEDGNAALAELETLRNACKIKDDIIEREKHRADENAYALGRRRGRLSSAGLFNVGQFTLHSGTQSCFKIDCDALADEDIEAVASMIADRVYFTKVEGVPRGGLRLARALEKYAKTDITPYERLLIVDDVLTTGTSMERHRNGRADVIGMVIFSRGPMPNWCDALFVLTEPKMLVTKWACDVLAERASAQPASGKEKSANSGQRSR